MNAQIFIVGPLNIGSFHKKKIKELQKIMDFKLPYLKYKKSSTKINIINTLYHSQDFLDMKGKKTKPKN